MMTAIGTKLFAISADTYIDPSLIYNRGSSYHAAKVIAAGSSKGAVCIHLHAVQIPAFGGEIYITIIINDSRTDISMACHLIQEQSGMCVYGIQDGGVGICSF